MHVRYPLDSLRLVLTAATVLLLGGCQPAPPEEPTDAQAEAEASAFQGDAARASYSLGFTIASNLQEQFGDGIEQEALVSGIVDRLQGRERQVSEEAAQQALTALAEKQKQIALARSDATLAAGIEYLEENGNRDGITTTASGLQYEVLVAGEGAKPTAADTVTTHYHGTLIDGRVFDSSVDRGRPASFAVNGVIRGWTEALQLMGVGSKWRLFIPPELAYGERAVGSIPANSTLIFDVELLSIDDAS